MTVSSTTNKQSYNGNGSQSVFAYGFKIFADTDIQVYVGTTLKTLSTHYTLSGVGAAGGGNVTFTTGNIPASGTGNVTILRSLALTQGVDLVNYGRFDAEVIESQYDKLVMMVQQLQEQADRTIRFNTTVSDAGGVEITDTVAERSNKVLAYDNAGDLSVANELGEWKGNWATNTAFAPRDLVLDAATNNVYICLVAHTSGTLSSDVSSSKWALVINASAVAASASTATTKANQASTSASAAATSNTNSGNSATASANSATASANSATASGNSATASGNSATAAASSASTATTKRNESSSSATAAANSATAAASSASSASSAATTAVNAVIDSAPAALNTLNELAAALGDDANFGTTVTNSIATKLPLAGGTMTGPLVVNDTVTVDALTVDNLTINGNDIASTNANGNISLTPNGGGNVEINSDTLTVIGVEGESASIALIADEADNNADVWKVTNNIGNTLTIGNQISGSIVDHITITPNATVANSTAAFAGKITAAGTVTADGLTVDGVSTLNNHVKVANGYSMGWGDITTRITGNSTSDIISAYTAGSESLRLDAAGNLGLGVVPATWHSNYDVLQMGEQTMLYAHADGIGNDSATYLGTNVYENSGAKYLRTDKSSLYRQQSGKHNFYVAPSGTAGSAISWTNAMTIDNSGKVGINRTPSTAYAKLEVGGADNAALINAEASGVFAGLGVQSGGLGLYVNNSNKMTIDSSGNVGIGSSSPTAKLDVVGPASVTSFTGTTALGMVTRGSTGATDYSGIDFKGNNQTNPIARIAALTTGGGSKLQFGTSNVYGSGITNTAMTIDPTGQVLVGQTTAPSLASALSLKAYTTGGSTPTALKTNTATDGYYAAWFVNAAGANKGYIYTSATATSFSTVSDYRLKTDVQPMTGATARLMQLNPVNFEWISSAGDRVDGFLAHELGAVIPESATGTHNGIKDEEYQATPATGDVYTAAIAEVATESQVMETVETGSYVNLAGETIVETTEQGVTTDLVETVVQRQDVDGVSTEVEVEVTTKVPTMETVITIPAVAEVIHSADVEHPETLEDGQAWRETTAQVIATRSVPDMQGIDQAKVVPILVATIQELIARIEALEA